VLCSTLDESLLHWQPQSCDLGSIQLMYMFWCFSDCGNTIAQLTFAMSVGVYGACAFEGLKLPADSPGPCCAKRTEPGTRSRSDRPTPNTKCKCNRRI
jgi:hypothetical protein